jgi:hypothetical protein
MVCSARIKQVISSTFDRHANLSPNPMFYRENIMSLEELRSVLYEILARLKEEIKKRAPVEMPVPLGPTKPLITGPSA